MPETGGDAALPLAKRLRTACSRAAGSVAARVTCSVGLVTFERPPADLEELLTMADGLMSAKAAGGDGVRHARVATEARAADGRLLPFAPHQGTWADQDRAFHRDVGGAWATVPWSER